MNKPQESAAFDLRQVQELRKRIAQGEGIQLEFKRKATFPDKIVREMIAFANTKGGTLLIGVNDDGELSGLKHPEGESHVIQEALKKCRPKLPVKETFIPIGNSRTILHYQVEESLKKPHYFLNDDGGKESFVRVEDKSIQASREMREIIKRQQRNKDIRFQYGEAEDLLMKYLDRHAHITLKQFVQLTGLKKFYASRKLIVLVLADVLRINAHEKGDVYALGFRPK
ncbi:MAG: ATP-binding protein [Cyclobacteriaceae bacterium]|nr:ATP-binding protein [Cyclobacteriaceae bacterium]